MGQTDGRTDTQPFRRPEVVSSAVVETDERTRPIALPLKQQTRGTPLLQ